MAFSLLYDFGRYLAVGGLSAAVDFGIFSLLAKQLGMHPLAANSVSRPIGGLVCFFANKYWTFGSREACEVPRQILKFCCVFVASLALSNLFLWLFLLVIPGMPVTAKALAEGIVVVFNFFCLKYWTFKCALKQSSRA